MNNTFRLMDDVTGNITDLRCSKRIRLTRHKKGEGEGGYFFLLLKAHLRQVL